KRLMARAEAAIEQRAAPDPAARAKGMSLVWARAGDVEGRLQTIEGYAFTAKATVLAVEEIARRRPVGALTPSQALGADFAERIEGTTVEFAVPSPSGRGPG